MLFRSQTLLGKYETDGSKYFLADRAKPIYEAAISTALQLSEKNKTPQYNAVKTDKKYKIGETYLTAAVNFSEKNKALVLLENLKDAKARTFGGVPQNLVDEERNLRAEVAYLEKQRYEAATDSAKTTTQRQLFAARETFRRFVSKLERDFPKYFQLKFSQNEPLTISAIQNALEPTTAAVSYFVGDSSLFVFCFSKTDFHYFEKKMTPQYLSPLRGFGGQVNATNKHN